MANPGQMRDSLKTELQRLVENDYPLLRVVEDAPELRLKGGLPVTDVTGKELGLYQVEIKFPASYPKNIPIVREIGGKIPKIADRHFNEDGAACLFVRDETYKFWPPGTTVKQFIDGPVKDFFLGQIVFEQTGKFPGERKHGIDGILDFYEEAIGTRDPQAVIQFIEYLLHPNIKGHRKCFCGSTLKIRDCHLTTLQALKGKIRLIDAEESLKQLVRHFGRSSSGK